MRSILGAALAIFALAGATALNAQQSASTGAFAEYEALLKEIAGLQVYNQLVQQQIENQQRSLEELQVAIEGVPDLERQLPPLLTRMIDSLARFIELDMPFESDVRRESLARLQEIVLRSDVNDAEKFRRVLEAWEIENEYGNTFGFYQGQLEIDGAPREVDFLRIGRIALLYQTPDLEYTGAWDHQAGEWVQLSSAQRNSVREALRMARNQIAPAMVLLPVPPPRED